MRCCRWECQESLVYTASRGSKVGWTLRELYGDFADDDSGVMMTMMVVAVIQDVTDEEKTKMMTVWTYMKKKAMVCDTACCKGKIR